MYKDWIFTVSKFLGVQKAAITKSATKTRRSRIIRRNRWQEWNLTLSSNNLKEQTLGENNQTCKPIDLLNIFGIGHDR